MPNVVATLWLALLFVNIRIAHCIVLGGSCGVEVFYRMVRFYWIGMKVGCLETVGTIHACQDNSSSSKKSTF